jgi:predicted transcriptional regulator of viral defense system|tara:strand:+ start:693 stop:1229 length:537 start_codon:yes stop_codon:yes gene_type:complete
MKQTDAIKKLDSFDRRGRFVYAARDLAKVLHGDTPRAHDATVNRLVKEGILQRPVKGVYVYALSQHRGKDTLELIARTLRRGAYNYVSLESALSEWGAISQIPVGRLTVMTTGRKGEYKTPYGVIEFTHTKRPLTEVLASGVERGRPLRIASKQAALRDLKRVGRNTHLLIAEELADD